MNTLIDLFLHLGRRVSHEATGLLGGSAAKIEHNGHILLGVSFLALSVAVVVLVPAMLRTLRDAHDSRARAEQLESAHLQLRSLYERLQETEALRSRFLANVSHELRTPLSLILGTTETVLLGPEGELSKPTARTIRKNALLLYRQVDDLLALARNDAGELRLAYAHTDLSALVHDTAAYFAGLAATREVRLEVEVPAELPAEIDPAKVERVLLNLLFNAFKFTPPAGRIRCVLEADDEGGQAILSVTDTGPGVPDEARERIFLPFEQGSAKLPSWFGGTGLGLAISRELARAHGGSIQVSSEREGGGSTFTVRLPLRAPAGIGVEDDGERSGEISLRVAQTAAAELACHEPEEEPVAGRPDDGQRRPEVLVVEDNEDLRRFLAGVLSPRYRVRTAEDGEEALALALEAPPDLVLTDVMMPRCGGDVLLQRMRAQEALRHVPVVVLTAAGNEETCVRMLGEGAQDYVTKPFRIAELQARVETHVASKRAREALSVVVHDQRKDLGALAAEVAENNRRLQRTLAEAQVARELAEQAARVKTNFLAMMSHELRTPVAALELQLSLFEPPAGEDTEEPAEPAEQVSIDIGSVARARRCSRRVRDLVESLLCMARAESGRLRLELEQVDLFELAQEVIGELSTTAEENRVLLRLEGDRRQPELESDPNLLRLVLVNLIGNAVKLTRDGEVMVHIERVDGAHRITVGDTSPGVARHMRESIFEPFEQPEDVRRQDGDGSGLGPAIVRDLTRALGGDVRLVAAGSSGTAFELTLPPPQSALPEEKGKSHGPTPSLPLGAANAVEL